MDEDATTAYDYSPPVATLLTYGKAQLNAPEKWPNYLELGFGPEHIPDLIRIATDEQLNTAETESFEVWAPLHALRVLGQLRSEAAIEPLLLLFETSSNSDDEWMNREIPDVYGMIGPAALSALAAYVADVSHKEFARITAIASIEKMATYWPDVRTECVALLMQQLEHFTENDPEINAFLILSLVALQAKEAAPLIERAYAANSVEVEVMGDWDAVQVDLGLKSPDEAKLTQIPSSAETPVAETPVLATPPQGVLQNTVADTPPKNQSDKAAHKKSKNKLAKQSRKKNRKR